MDKDTTVADLKSRVFDFCEERHWNKSHNPKDLSIGISTEANELMDLFRFKSNDQMKEMMKDKKKRERIGEELADTLIFPCVLPRCMRLTLTISSVIRW